MVNSTDGPPPLEMSRDTGNRPGCRYFGKRIFLSHWAGPGPGRTTRRQVSWLADQRLRTVFPAPPTAGLSQWHAGSGLLAHSCGHSAGISPASLL